jgi:hypothetical protein
MHGKNAVEVLHDSHEFQFHALVQSGGAPPQSKTLARW